MKILNSFSFGFLILSTLTQTALAGQHPDQTVLVPTNKTVEVVAENTRCPGGYFPEIKVTTRYFSMEKYSSLNLKSTCRPITCYADFAGTKGFRVALENLNGPSTVIVDSTTKREAIEKCEELIRQKKAGKLEVNTFWEALEF